MFVGQKKKGSILFIYLISSFIILMLYMLNTLTMEMMHYVIRKFIYQPVIDNICHYTHVFQQASLFSPLQGNTYSIYIVCNQSIKSLFRLHFILHKPTNFICYLFLGVFLYIMFYRNVKKLAAIFILLKSVADVAGDGKYFYELSK